MKLTTEEKLANYKKFRADPWEFLIQCVFTLDQVSKDEPIRRFPDKEYLKMYCRFWQKYNLMAIPKSRRMTMSWITISLYVWDAIFHRGRFFAFVSKKEDDANELVNRAKFIVDNLDRNLMPDELIPKYRSVYNVLEFTDINSKIQGFPQGADQLRQFTFSGIFGDESAFWENAEKFYAASFPTLDGGGRMTLVSSPAPGFFKKLCFDAMDRPGDINVAEYSPDYKNAMEGVRVWQNIKNKFLVFELHYTADPTKRSPEYKESIKSSMPIQEYMREYELHWDTFSGQPVYPEFGKIHILHEKPEPVAGLPMLAGIDWGLTPAFVIGQLVEGQLVIFEEITEINMGAARFMEKIINHIRTKYPTFSDTKKNWLLFADPAGQAKSQSDESTCFQMASKYFNVIPGPVAWEERRNAVVHFLMKLEKGEPAFQVYGKGCPIVLKGFEGGYRFDDKAIEIEPNKLRPIKDVHSHCFTGDTLVSTPTGQVEIKSLRVGDLVNTPDGPKRVTATMSSFAEKTRKLSFSSGQSFVCTDNHPIWSGSSFVRADALQYMSAVVSEDICQNKSIQFKNLTVSNFIESLRDISKPITSSAGFICTGMFGSFIPKQKLDKAFTFTTKTATSPTTISTILNSFLQKNTALFTLLEKLFPKAKSRQCRKLQRNGTAQKREELGTQSTLKSALSEFLSKNTPAFSAGGNIIAKLGRGKKATVVCLAKEELDFCLGLTTRKESALSAEKILSLTSTQKRSFVISSVQQSAARVYDITVEGAHCFYANGILVSNCHDALQYLCSGVKLTTASNSRPIPVPGYFLKGPSHGQRIL